MRFPHNCSVLRPHSLCYKRYFWYFDFSWDKICGGMSTSQASKLLPSTLGFNRSKDSGGLSSYLAYACHKDDRVIFDGLLHNLTMEPLLQTYRSTTHYWPENQVLYYWYPTSQGLLVTKTRQWHSYLALMYLCAWNNFRQFIYMPYHKGWR